MEICELKENDIKEAMELVWEVFSRFEAPEYLQKGIDEFRKFIEPETIVKRMDSGELRLWGCFYSGRIVGVAAAKSFEEEPFKGGLWSGSHVSLLFVKEEYQRRGIARRLFGAVRQACAVAGEITVNSSPYAVEAYKHLGFVPVDDEKTLNGIRFTPMKYVK
jgi:GNAT superfamily N-acetyltransferase